MQFSPLAVENNEISHPLNLLFEFSTHYSIEEACFRKKVLMYI